MKDRALYHLLMVSARSTRELVGPDQAARVDLIASTLVLGKEGRGPVHLDWRDETGPRELDVDLGRFSFYLRGDVPSLLAKRKAGTDLRAENWLEAHRLWGEILGDARLGDTLVPAARGIPTPDFGTSNWAQCAALWCAVIALATSAVALPTGAPPLLLAALLGALSIAWVAPPRSGWLALPPVALAVGIAVAVHPTSAMLRGPAAGLVLIAAVSQLAPRRGAVGLARLPREVLALVAVGLALAVAPAAWWIAAAVVFAADASALVLRREAARAAVMTAWLAAGIVIGALLSIGIDRAVLHSSPTADTAWVIASAAAAVVALAVAVLTVPFLTRDRLSAIVGTAMVGVAGLVAIDERSTPVWMVSGACGILLAFLSEQRRRSKHSGAASERDGFTARSAEAPPIVAADGSQSISLGMPKVRR